MYFVNTLLQATIINISISLYSWLARTNPADTARVESRTFICTDNRSETIPTPRDGVKGTLGNWISPQDYDQKVKERFTGIRLDLVDH